MNRTPSFAWALIREGWFTSATSLGFFVLSHPLGDQRPAGANPGVTLITNYVLNRTPSFAWALIREGWFTSATSLGFFVLSHPFGDQRPEGANPGVALFILNSLSLTS